MRRVSRALARVSCSKAQALLASDPDSAGAFTDLQYALPIRIRGEHRRNLTRPAVTTGPSPRTREAATCARKRKSRGWTSRIRGEPASFTRSTLWIDHRVIPRNKLAQQLLQLLIRHIATPAEHDPMPRTKGGTKFNIKYPEKAIAKV